MAIVIHNSYIAKLYIQNYIFTFTDQGGSLEPYPAIGLEVFKNKFSFVYINQVLSAHAIQVKPHVVKKYGFYEDKREIQLFSSLECLDKIKDLHILDDLKEFKCLP